MAEEGKKYITGPSPYRDYPSINNITTKQWDLRKYDRKPTLFWSSPDGSDILPKLKVSTGSLACIGGLLGTYEVLYQIHPSHTYAEKAARLARWTFPFAFAGFSYSAMVHFLGGMRGKDDRYNHMAGGALMGALAGKFTSNAKLGTGWAIFLCMACGFIKEGSKREWVWMPMDLAPRDNGFLLHENRRLTDVFRKDYPPLMEQLKKD